MRKIFALLLLAVVFCSCSVGKITCKHSTMKPVVFLRDDGTSYIVNVPFCDTVLITPKVRGLKN